MSELTELVDVVCELQEEITDSSGSEYFNLSVNANGYYTVVKFLDLVIWSSEDDMRIYDEEKDDYEPFAGYLRRAIGEELAKLALIDI